MPCSQYVGADGAINETNGPKYDACWSAYGPAYPVQSYNPYGGEHVWTSYVAPKKRPDAIDAMFLDPRTGALNYYGQLFGALMANDTTLAREGKALNTYLSAVPSVDRSKPWILAYYSPSLHEVLVVLARNANVSISSGEVSQRAGPLILLSNVTVPATLTIDSERIDLPDRWVSDWQIEHNEMFFRIYATTKRSVTSIVFGPCQGGPVVVGPNDTDVNLTCSAQLANGDTLEITTPNETVLGAFMNRSGFFAR